MSSGACSDGINSAHRESRDPRQRAQFARDLLYFGEIIMNLGAPLIAFVAAVTIAMGSTVYAEGTASAGRQLAQRWCSSCHQIEPNAPASDAAPPFASLGVQRGTDPGWIRAWLADPHPPMQGINLSRQQIDDIVAYLQSLAPAQ